MITPTAKARGLLGWCASVSLVQRKFNVGYSRAGRIVDQLADHRVIGGYQGSKSREVLMNLPDVDELLERLGLE